MEIVTYVRQGAITHKTDGQRGAHRRRRRPGDERRLGHRHAEYISNPIPPRCSRSGSCPRQDGGAPAWGAKPFPKADRSASSSPWQRLRQRQRRLAIRADARVLGATLKAAT